MLGERSEQRGLREADRLYLDHVGLTFRCGPAQETPRWGQEDLSTCETGWLACNAIRCASRGQQE